MGEVPSPLSVVDLLAYCELTDLQGLEARQAFYRVMRCLDAAYLDYMAEKRQAALQ